MNLSRRHFLHSSLVLGTGLPHLSHTAETSYDICVFNKPLQHMSYGEQAELVAEIGFAGIEGTVRKGGHVEPDKVEKDLPAQVKALQKNGVEMTLMTTDINNADDEIHQRVLKTAANLGITRFRMGSIKYDTEYPITEQLKNIRETFRKLVDFCKPLGIQPLYQNHSGAGRFGAGLWDLKWVLADIDPADAAVAFDIRHATVEGGQSWPTEFQLIRPHFGLVYCKDFVWKDDNKRPENVPLGTGRVEYPRFFSMLKKTDYDGPISLHMEYKDHRKPELLNESIAAVRADMKSIQEIIRKS